jgi:hypothetical protein
LTGDERSRGRGNQVSPWQDVTGSRKSCTVQTRIGIDSKMRNHTRDFSCVSAETTVHYPLYVQRLDGQGYRGVFADFPWIEVEGRTFDDLAVNAELLVQRLYHRSEHIVPAPTSDMSALQALDMDDGEGLWMFVDIDLTNVLSHSVFVQISLCRSVLQEIDLAARRSHIGRSAYIALACFHELAHVGDEVALRRS